MTGDTHHQLGCQLLECCVRLFSEQPVGNIQRLGDKLAMKRLPIAVDFCQLGKRNGLQHPQAVSSQAATLPVSTFSTVIPTWFDVQSTNGPSFAATA